MYDPIVCLIPNVGVALAEEDVELEEALFEVLDALLELLALLEADFVDAASCQRHFLHMTIIRQEGIYHDLQDDELLILELELDAVAGKGISFAKFG